jgi:hypothetical protein
MRSIPNARPPAVGHVLGLGTMWQRRGCVVNCYPGSNSPSFYRCAAARREYARTPGCKGDLPVETRMGPGSGCRWAADGAGGA